MYAFRVHFGAEELVLTFTLSLSHQDSEAIMLERCRRWLCRLPRVLQTSIDLGFSIVLEKGEENQCRSNFTRDSEFALVHMGDTTW